MRALLRAGLRRDLHSIYTWLALLANLICGLIPLNAFKLYDTEFGGMDSGFVSLFLIVGMAISVILRLLRGALEHESGMSRNKLIGGASKGELLLSELIIACGTAFVQCVLTAGSILLFALTHVRYFEEAIALRLFLVYLCSYLCFAVLMTLVWYYAPSTAAVIVIGSSLFAGIGMGGLMLNAKLSQPQYFITQTDIVKDKNGRMISHREEKTPNPEALHGRLRTFCQAVDTVNPLMTTLQSVNLIDMYRYPEKERAASSELKIEKQRTLSYRPASIFGATLLLFAGGMLLAPKKNFN